MILLLCMTVGMFSACTGDDGEAGPPGPPGPPGPAAEPTETMDMDEPTLHYAFLGNWGYPDGLNCNNLETTDPFPGPAELDPYTDANGNALIASFEAQCDGNDMPLLAEMAVTTGTGDDRVPGFDSKYLGLGVGEGNLAATAELVFIKTMAGEESDLGDPVFVPETDRSPASLVGTTTKFAGGPFMAEFADEGSGEGLQRLLLYSECDKGTAPPDLKGEWRGVLKTETITTIDPQSKVRSLAGTKTTTKICVRLDAMPNAVKCFIDVRATNPAIAASTQQIAVYKDGKAMTVGKVLPSLPSFTPDGDAAETALGADQDFFGTVTNPVGTSESISIFTNVFVDATPDTDPPVAGIDSGGMQVGRLCNLIAGAEK